METKTKTIARVNNVAIMVGSDKNEMVPIKPICEVLGIDAKTQVDKIKEHPILSSTGGLSPLVAADGKEREMFCIPFKYVFGWLFTINPGNVKEEARESIVKYQLECYDALYEYFAEYQEYVEIRGVAIENQWEKYQELQKNFREASTNLNEAKKKLNEAKAYNFEKYKADKQQFRLDFIEHDSIAKKNIEDIDE